MPSRSCCVRQANSDGAVGGKRRVRTRRQTICPVWGPDDPSGSLAPPHASDGVLAAYVSPNPIGVNDFLKLGQIGTETVAQALGGQTKTYESSDPAPQRLSLEAAGKTNPLKSDNSPRRAQ
jgi:hypothetical protein